MAKYNQLLVLNDDLLKALGYPVHKEEDSLSCRYLNRHLLFINASNISFAGPALIFLVQVTRKIL